MAYPMVCFCDIPLSKNKKHIGVYGNYGIGLKKTWSRRKNLSPIIYTRKNARTSKNIEQMINWSATNLNNIGNDEAIEKLKGFVSDFIMFTKPYYGEMQKGEKKIKRRFYDEREWRWIPKIERKDTYIHLDRESFSNEEFREYANRLVAKHYKLTFKIGRAHV